MRFDWRVKDQLTFSTSCTNLNTQHCLSKTTQSCRGWAAAKGQSGVVAQRYTTLTTHLLPNGALLPGWHVSYLGEEEGEKEALCSASYCIDSISCRLNGGAQVYRRSGQKARWNQGSLQPCPSLRPTFSAQKCLWRNAARSDSLLNDWTLPWGHRCTALWFDSFSALNGLFYLLCLSIIFF